MSVALYDTKKRNHFLKSTAILFVFWLLLSGKWDVFHAVIGFVAAVVITWISLPLMKLTSPDRKKTYYAFDIPFLRYSKYWLWLLKQIIVANIEVAMIILNPKLPIEPQMVSFKKEFSNPIAQATLSNSIILTPGTLTVDVNNGVYTIHTLTQKGAEEIERGEANELIGRIGHVFSEDINQR